MEKPSRITQEERETEITTSRMREGNIKKIKRTLKGW